VKLFACFEIADYQFAVALLRENGVCEIVAVVRELLVLDVLPGVVIVVSEGAFGGEQGRKYEQAQSEDARHARYGSSARLDYAISVCRWILLAAEKLGILFGEIVPFFGKIVQGEDGGNRADGDTSAAIDTFDRIDVKHGFALKFGAILFRVDAVNRTGVHTRGVFGSNTGFGDYVGHL
jgi:hypothetical protein